MANIIKGVADAKVSPDFTIGEALSVGVAKVVTERLLAQYPRWNGKALVGNASFKSGLIKLGLAAGAWKLGMSSKGLGAKASRVASTAMTVDGVEDLIAASIQRFAPGFMAQEQKSNMMEAI